MRAALTLGLLAVLVLTACTDGPPPEADEPPAVSSTPELEPSSSSSPSSPSPPPPPEPAPEPITLAFAGDVHFEGALRARLEDPATALAPYTGTLAAADLAMVNLETSVGSGGTPDPDKRFTFQAPPSAFDALAAAGVDVVTMANNHAVDYGYAALDQTFAAIDTAPLAVVGLGRDARAAFAPTVLDVDGVEVAAIGATVADLDPTADPTSDWAATATRAGTADAVDPTRLLRTVTRASSAADVVVVYMHWGVQGETCPDQSQLSLARRLVRAGADVVVGSHAHEFQGAARVADGYVAFGLGNYAWYQPSETGVLTLTVQPRRGRVAEVTDAEWEPGRIGADGLPVVIGAPGPLPDPGC